jgi:hypothetical protein
MTDRWRKIKICPICDKPLKALGYARHMAMHRDKIKKEKSEKRPK